MNYNQCTQCSTIDYFLLSLFIMPLACWILFASYVYSLVSRISLLLCQRCPLKRTSFHFWQIDSSESRAQYLSALLMVVILKPAFYNHLALWQSTERWEQKPLSWLEHRSWAGWRAVLPLGSWQLGEMHLDSTVCTLPQLPPAVISAMFSPLTLENAWATALKLMHLCLLLNSQASLFNERTWHLTPLLLLSHLVSPQEFSALPPSASLGNEEATSLGHLFTH